MFTTLTFWLWVATVPLVALYAMTGIMKATQPIEKLAKTMAWAGDLSPALVRFVAVAELAGAAGLVLPVLTGIAAWLTPLAAIGLSLIQILAIGLHVSRGEVKVLPINLVLLPLSLFVAWGYRGLLGLGL